MLTISSIAVAPAPQSTPTVRAQPVTPARPSSAVSRESTGGAVVAPQGEAARAQMQAPSPLSPVAPTQEGQRADAYNNAAAPERSGLPPPTANTVRGGETSQEKSRADARAVEEERRIREAEQQRLQAAKRRLQEQAGATERVKQAGRASDEDKGFPEVKNPALEALDNQIKELLPNMWKASRAAVDMMIGEAALKAAQERAKRLEELQNRLNVRPLANVPVEAAQTYDAAAKAADQPFAGAQLDRLV